jgi:uncharacterized protein YlxW (UPF0749 family)
MTALGTTPRLRALAGGPVFVLVVTGLVGFLLVSQFRGTQRFSQRLSAESEGDLARILASLTTEADSLRDEISALKLQLVDLEASSRSDEASAKAAEDQLQALQVLAGTVPVAGPGLTLDIQDPGGAVGYDTLIDVVQELRDAGAEAVAVNGQRVGVSSAFANTSGKVALDGVVLTAPFKVSAIGQPATLESGLKIPGGALDALAALKDVHVELQRSARLDLPPLATPPTFRSAHPVSSTP